MREHDVQVTMKNVTEDEVSFIINQTNLRKWAFLSVAKRCVVFHRHFGVRRIGPKVMLKIMKQAGLTKKKVHV